MWCLGYSRVYGNIRYTVEVYGVRNRVAHNHYLVIHLHYGSKLCRTEKLGPLHRSPCPTWNCCIHLPSPFKNPCAMTSTDPQARRLKFQEIYGRHVDSLAKLVKQLPDSVPLATSEDQIPAVFSSLDVPDDPNEAWEIFDRRFNSLFGEEIRNASGRLVNFRRGPLGIEAVLDYLEVCRRLPIDKFEWEAAMPKILRLCNEAKALIKYVNFICLCAVSLRSNHIISYRDKSPAVPATKPKSRTVKATPAGKSNSKGKGKAKQSNATAVPESTDDDWAPPKRPRDEETDSDASQLFDEDGEDLLTDTEQAKARVCLHCQPYMTLLIGCIIKQKERRQKKKARLAQEEDEDMEPRGKKTKRKKKKVLKSSICPCGTLTCYAHTEHYHPSHNLLRR